MTITEILNEIHRLPLDDQKRIRERLLEDSGEMRIGLGLMTQREFDQKLMAEGFLTHLPDESAACSNFDPVPFVGRPISETIIDDRG